MSWQSISTCYIIERLIFDFSSRWLLSPRARVELTPKESDVLLHLAGSPDRWVSSRELAACVWRHVEPVHTASYRHVVSALRAKLQELEGGAYVRSSRNLGYRLVRADGTQARVEFMSERERA